MKISLVVSAFIVGNVINLLQNVVGRSVIETSDCSNQFVSLNYPDCNEDGVGFETKYVNKRGTTDDSPPQKKKYTWVSIDPLVHPETKFAKQVTPSQEKILANKHESLASLTFSGTNTNQKAVSNAVISITPMIKQSDSNVSNGTKLMNETQQSETQSSKLTVGPEPILTKKTNTKQYASRSLGESPDEFQLHQAFSITEPTTSNPILGTTGRMIKIDSDALNRGEGSNQALIRAFLMQRQGVKNEQIPTPNLKQEKRSDIKNYATAALGRSFTNNLRPSVGVTSTDNKWKNNELKKAANVQQSLPNNANKPIPISHRKSSVDAIANAKSKDGNAKAHSRSGMGGTAMSTAVVVQGGLAHASAKSHGAGRKNKTAIATAIAGKGGRIRADAGSDDVNVVGDTSSSSSSEQGEVLREIIDAELGLHKSGG